MPRKPVIESMTKIQLKTCTIRVWRQEKYLEYKPQNNQDLIDWAIRCYKDGLPFSEIIEELSDMERVNAVELIDKSGHGLVYYPDWP